MAWYCDENIEIVNNLKDLEFLSEKNLEACIVSKFGYSKAIEELYGIECKVEQDNKSVLEFKYKLDKSICNESCSV